MEYFEDNLSDSAAEQPLSTPKKIPKTTVKGASPSKVVKRTTTTPRSAAGVNSPLPKVSTNCISPRYILIGTQNREEMQPYDKLLLELRSCDPPKAWKEIETLFTAAGGVTSSYKYLKDHRYNKVKAACIDVTAADVSTKVNLLGSLSDFCFFRLTFWSLPKPMSGSRLRRNSGVVLLRK